MGAGPPALSSDPRSSPRSSPQATWKTLEGGWWNGPVPLLLSCKPDLLSLLGAGMGGGAWRRTPSIMNHSSTLGGVAMGLSRKEKHLPGSQVPQPQETTALEGDGEQTNGWGDSKTGSTAMWPWSYHLLAPGLSFPSHKRKETRPNVCLVLNPQVTCPQSRGRGRGTLSPPQTLLPHTCP